MMNGQGLAPQIVLLATLVASVCILLLFIYLPLAWQVTGAMDTQQLPKGKIWSRNLQL